MRLAVAISLAGAAVIAVLATAPAGHRPAPGRDAFLARADPTSVLRFSVVLRLPGERSLERRLRSRRAHGTIGAAEFGRRYGLPLPVIARLGHRLEQAGLRVTSNYPQRTALDVRGSVAAVARLFRVTFGEYRMRDGRRYHAPLGPVRIPPTLAGAVTAVAGLNTRPIAKPVDIPNAVNGLKPDDLALAYDVAPLHRMGLHGEGQTVAIVSGSPFDDQDVRGFDQGAGITGRPVAHCAAGNTRRLRCDFRHRDIAFEAFAGEDALDIDAVRGMAPQAQILNYEDENLATGSFAESIGRAVDAITRDGRASVVSISYGDCDVARYRAGEYPLVRADRLRAEQAFKAAVARGINIFVSSGDAGAYECQRFSLADHRPTASWPADSPWVISVGGTLLSVRRDGTYLDEAGWEDILENSGGGGGVNPFDRRPAWQRGPGVLDRFSTGARQFPDVAAAADPDSGVYTFFGGVGQAVGGTSAAAPFWAGAMALVGQLARRGKAGRLPYLNPVFYELAAKPQGAAPFHDVVRGGDRLYMAKRGWDYATGLGSPDVANLAHAVVAFVKKHPAGR